MRNLSPTTIVAALILGCAAIAAPMLLKPFYTFQISTILAYSIGVLSLVFLTGITGQISLGHGAFFAIGAYVVAILVVTAQWPYYLALPAAPLACLLLGYLIGVPAVRLEGLYLALATFSLAVAVPQILKYSGFRALTGGFQGLVLDPPEMPSFIRLSTDQVAYCICLFFVALSLWAVRNLLAGSIGRALEAVRDQPMAAAAMGVDVASAKAAAFAVSAMLAGLSGALSAMLTLFVSPDGFNVFLSISLLVGAVVGGLANPLGCIFGAAFIVLIPDVSESVSKAIPWAIYGALLILTIFVMPSGLTGAVAWLGRKIGAAILKPRKTSTDIPAT